MGCGCSEPETPKLGQPTIELEPSRVVTVNHDAGSVDIAYRVFREDLKDGENGVVVWQHAYGDTSENTWAKCKVDMFDGYCVILPDALGHGTESSKPTDPLQYTPAALATNIIAILDKENISKAHYVGYSIGSYTGCCLLAHYPERWSSVALGGWNPEAVLPGFVAGILANTYNQPWMDPKRDKPALKQASYACCNKVPNLEKALEECSKGSDGYPRMLLFAGKSDTVFRGIRACAEKYRFSSAFAPGSHEHVNVYAAGINEIRDALLQHINSGARHLESKVQR